MSLKTSWYFGEGHVLETKNFRNKPKKKNGSVKVYRGAELKAKAAELGYDLSKNAGQTGLDFSKLPEGLKHLIK